MAGAKKGRSQGRGPRKSHGSETDGAKTMAKLARISQKKQDEEIRRSLKLGLEAADRSSIAISPSSPAAISRPSPASTLS